jgi:hypothetical protein
VGLHKKIETQEKEISDLKAESSQIKIETGYQDFRVVAVVILSVWCTWLYATEKFNLISQ